MKILAPAAAFRYDSFTDKRFLIMTGFSKTNAQHIFTGWGVPEMSVIIAVEPNPLDPIKQDQSCANLR